MLGISISIIKGKNGILIKSNNTKKQYLQTSDKEQLDLIVRDVKLKNVGKLPFSSAYKAFEEDKTTVKRIIYPKKENVGKIRSGNSNAYIIVETKNGYIGLYNTDGEISLIEEDSKYLKKYTVIYDAKGGKFSNEEETKIITDLNYGEILTILSREEEPEKAEEALVVLEAKRRKNRKEM